MCCTFYPPPAILNLTLPKLLTHVSLGEGVTENQNKDQKKHKTKVVVANSHSQEKKFILNALTGSAQPCSENLQSSSYFIPFSIYFLFFLQSNPFIPSTLLLKMYILMGHSRSLFLYIRLFNSYIKHYKILPMTGLEPQTFGIGSDH